VRKKNGVVQFSLDPRQIRRIEKSLLSKTQETRDSMAIKTALINGKRKPIWLEL
jgi:hypothetical protein